MPSSSAGHPQPIAQHAQADRIGVAGTAAHLGRLAEPDDGGHVERARAIAALVAAAVDQRLEVDRRIPFRHIERADPFRAVHLVRAQRDEIDAERLTSSGTIARRLHRIAVKQARRARSRSSAISASGCSTPISLLAAITLTSSVSSPNGVTQPVEIDAALAIDLEIRDAKSVRAPARGTDRAPRDARWRRSRCAGGCRARAPQRP